MNCCQESIEIGCFNSCDTCITVPEFGVFALTDRFLTIFKINNNLLSQSHGVDANGYYLIDISALPHDFLITFSATNITTDLEMIIAGEKEIHGSLYTHEYTCFSFKINKQSRTLVTTCDITPDPCTLISCDFPQHLVSIDPQNINIQRVHNREEQIGYVLADIAMTVGFCVETVRLKRYVLYDTFGVSYVVPIVFMTPTIILTPQTNETMTIQIGPFLYAEWASPIPVSLILDIVIGFEDATCGNREVTATINLTLLP